MNVTPAGTHNFWHGAGLGPAARPAAPAAIVAEETIGSSLWVLELGAYVHEPALIAALDELAANSGGVNPFFEPEFLSASVDRLGEPGKRLMVLWERIGEASFARLAFPVIEEKIGFPRRRVLRAWSHPFAPLATPLIDLRDAEESCMRFAKLLARLEPPNKLALVFEDFPVESPAAMMFRRALCEAGFTVMEAAAKTRAFLPSAGGRPAGEFLPILTHPKRRRELARQRHKLEALGQVTFDKACDFESIIVRFEEFLLLETRGWKGRKGTSIHILRKTASFARQAVAAFADRGRAAIYSLRVDGHAIASLIVLRSLGRYYPWKIAFDEHYQAYSPGVQLFIHASTDMLAQDGFTGADSLARERSWADRLWPARLELATLVVAGKDDAGSDGTSRQAVSVTHAIERLDRLKRLARRLLGR